MAFVYIRNPANTDDVRSVTLSDVLTVVDGKIATCPNSNLIGWVLLPDGPPKPPVSDDQIRAEAARRILEIAPEWRQRNLTARAAELALKIGDGLALTTEEQAERAAGQLIWDKIKAIRAASNVLEAMPIADRPQDYKDNAHWPA